MKHKINKLHLRLYYTSISYIRSLNKTIQVKDLYLNKILKYFKLT